MHFVHSETANRRARRHLRMPIREDPASFCGDHGQMPRVSRDRLEVTSLVCASLATLVDPEDHGVLLLVRCRRPLGQDADLAECPQALVKLLVRTQQT